MKFHWPDNKLIIIHPEYFIVPEEGEINIGGSIDSTFHLENEVNFILAGQPQITKKPKYSKSVQIPVIHYKKVRTKQLPQVSGNKDFMAHAPDTSELRLVFDTEGENDDKLAISVILLQYCYG